MTALPIIAAALATLVTLALTAIRRRLSWARHVRTALHVTRRTP